LNDKLKNINPKTLFILHLPPPVHGASLVGNNLYRYYSNQNIISCHFINLSTSDSIERIGKVNAIKYYKYIVIIKQVLISLVSFKPELCYITLTSKGVGFIKDFLIVLIVKAFKVKIVYHFHNKGVKGYQQKILFDILYKFTFRNANVILLSFLLYDDLMKYVHRNKVSICPNGLADNCNLSILKNNCTPLKNDAITNILFFSNLLKSKGVLSIINICNALKTKNLSFKFTIAGSEGDVSYFELRSLILANKLYDYIDIIDNSQSYRKEELYASSDIFILPTNNDCFPLVLIEAMQFSLPIISTVEGGISDIVENNVTGFLSKKGDLLSMISNIESLIIDADRRIMMGQNGRKKYENEFTEERFQKNINKIIIDIVGR